MHDTGVDVSGRVGNDCVQPCRPSSKSHARDKRLRKGQTTTEVAIRLI